MGLLGSSIDLRRRSGDEEEAPEAPVGNAELFFDLVFVFAVTQLSHKLIADPGWVAAGQVAVLFLAMWWAWIDTVWVANWLDVERVVVRLMLFALMGAGLFLSMAIPEAWKERGLVFAGGYVAMQVIRELFMLWAVRRHHRGTFRNYARILTWTLAAAPLWIAGGLAEPEARAPFWLAALAIDTLGPILFFWTPGLGRSTTGDWNVAGSHIAERCGLFVIVALGEFILVTGSTVAEEPWTTETMAGFAAAFLSSVAMWWLYFNVGAERAARSIEDSDDPGREGRLIYTYLHIPIVAAIIVSAAGDEMVLAHPHGSPFPAALLTLGGTTLFVASNLVFKRVLANNLPLSHLIGLGLLAALVPVSSHVTPVVLAMAASGVLAIVAAWESWSLRDLRRDLMRDGKGATSLDLDEPRSG